MCKLSVLRKTSLSRGPLGSCMGKNQSRVDLSLMSGGKQAATTILLFPQYRKQSKLWLLHGIQMLKLH